MEERALPKLTLREMERHCNNYFNPHNDPDDPTRDYPDGFVSLAMEIDQYSISTSAHMGVEAGAERIPWQKAYAQELALYKRARFI